MFKYSFIVRRTIAWLLDNLLFLLLILIILLAEDFLLRSNLYEIADKLGYQTTITNQGEVLNDFVDFCYTYGSFSIYFFVIALYFCLMNYFSKSCLQGSTVGKYITKLNVQKDKNNSKFLYSYIFFCITYYLMPYIYFHGSNNFLYVFILLFLIDMIFIIFKGQLLHNYIFRIRIVSKE